MSKPTVTDISRAPVELWPIGDIKPYPFNNKMHPEKHIDMLMRSIKVQGHLEPLILDPEGVIISGHGRFEALKRLGREKVAVRVLKDISETEAAALRISANRTVSTEYDTDMLSRELTRLSEETEMDLGILGFDEKELTMLITDIGEMDEDSLTIDMEADMKVHEAGLDEHAAAIEVRDVRLDVAFGFKYIALKDEKVITRFMAEAEAETGLTGVDAMLKAMTDYVEARSWP